MITYFARYMVINGELQWVEGMECHDQELTTAIRQVPGMHAQMAEWLGQGIVMGAA